MNTALRSLRTRSVAHGALATRARGVATTSVEAAHELLRDRASMREYAAAPVPDEVIADVLRLTQRAPTAFNTQPYVAIVVRTADDKARLAPAMLAANQAKITNAPFSVVFAADLEPNKGVSLLRDVGLASGVPEAVLNNLPQYLQAFSGEGTEQGSLAWSFKQTSFAGATFLYAAAAHGLVTCPMEGFDPEAVKAAVGLPDRYAVPFVISAGYAKDGAHARTSPRLPPTNVFFEGKFGDSAASIFEKKC